MIGVMGEVKMFVDNRIRLKLSEVGEDCAECLREDFTHENPVWHKLKRSGAPRGILADTPKTISTWYEEGGCIVLPRGGIGRVRGALLEHDLDWYGEDARVPGSIGEGPGKEHRIELYGYQEEMVQAALDAENCLLRAPTASGKTCVGISIIARADLPSLVVVHNSGLMRQWIERIGDELGMHSRDVGIIGGGKHRIKPLTVGLWQSVRNHLEELMPLFGLVLVDEVHRAAAKCVFGVVDSFPAKMRVGVSALERRADRKEFLIYDVFGDVVCEVPERELLDGGYVVEVAVRVVPTDFDCPWYRRMLDSGDLPLDAHHGVLEAMQHDVARNGIVLGLVAEHAAKGDGVMVFSQRREHCRRIDADLSALGIACGCMLGSKEDEAEFERTKRGMKDSSILAACCTYQAAGEALDLPRVSVGVCSTPIANSRDGKPAWNQVKGRLARTCAAEGKSSSVVYYLWDAKLYDRRPLENLCRWNRDVKVRVGPGRWVDGREFLKSMRGGTAQLVMT